MAPDLIHIAGFDIDRRHQEAFDRWYEEEHVPAILNRMGWERARRYVCMEGEPRDLVIYDLAAEALEVGGFLSEAPFRGYPDNHRIRDYRARTMRLLSRAGEDPRSASFINWITVEIAPARAAAFSRWYDEVHVPEIVACPGWLGNERYESLAGDPLFLAIYGLTNATQPFSSPEYNDAVGWDEHVDWIRGYHGFRIYRQTALIEA